MTAGDKPRRPHVSDEEQALWGTVTRSVKPLRRHRRSSKDDSATEATPARADTKPPRARRATASPKPSAPPPAATPPALAPLERRARQRLARGTESIDARLDLHGRTQSEAHAALLRFLRRAQADGAKAALVITGKGGGEGERGVLKRQVPLWLALPECRSLVVGFSDASIGHGGQGALYVRVRRAR